MSLLDTQPSNLTRKEATEQALLKYFTGKPCRKGHVCHRYTKTGHCVQCLEINATNFDRNNPGRISAYQKSYRAINADHLNEYLKEYNKSNPRKRDPAYYRTPEQREYKRNYASRRYKDDINYRLINIIRCRFRMALKNNAKVSSAVTLLGCSIPEAKLYIEVRFKKGMNWSNWGIGDGRWNLDHIIPLSSFDLTDLEEMKTACHITNLQPLWSKENLSKGSKIL